MLFKPVDNTINSKVALVRTNSHSSRRPGSFYAFISLFYGNTCCTSWPVETHLLPYNTQCDVVRYLACEFSSDKFINDKRYNKGYQFIPLSYVQRSDNNGKQFFKRKISTPGTRG